METNIKTTPEVWDYSIQKLIHKVYKTLPIYEEEGDWKKQQEAIILDLKGFDSLFADKPNFLNAAVKVAALSFAENHVQFRKLIFEAITELSELRKEVQ